MEYKKGDKNEALDTEIKRTAPLETGYHRKHSMLRFAVCHAVFGSYGRIRSRSYDSFYDVLRVALSGDMEREMIF